MCVRVTNMKGVDLNTFVFDWDLTFAVLLMNADGTVYHRYGGRDHESADGRLSMEALTRLVREGLETDREYRKAPKAREGVQKQAIEEIPVFAERLKKNPNVECFHCHMATEARREQAQKDGRWTPDDRWLWPLPDKAGLRLDPQEPTRVTEVAKDSPAAKAGLQKDDRLVSVNGTRVRTEPDVQWFLHDTPPAGGSLEVAFIRGTGKRTVTLALASGWKAATPLEYSWRPAMWLLRPDPGFGGDDLDAAEKQKLGLRADAFAVRVNYLIDWGDRAETGRNARKAGVRKGDILLSAGGVSDFHDHKHFQTWFRFTREPGKDVELKLWRDGKEILVSLPVLP
ncbi:MAG: PDZ domain-containing protein [Planctomycetia bacterium]|nr:PDZ domain-containing protein [Planctomycetia bacterium]